MDATRNEAVAGPSTAKTWKRNHNGQRLSRKTVSDTDRQRIVNAYLNGFTPRTISEMLSVKLSTVYGILKQYQQTGKVAALKRGGNHKKILSDEAAASIREWLEEDRNLSLGTLTDRLWEQYHVRVCRSTVGREIKRLKIPRRLQFNREAARRKFHAVSQNESVSTAVNECPASIKEEEFSSSDIDDIELGETILTSEDNGTSYFEAHPMETDPLESNPESTNTIAKQLSGDTFGRQGNNDESEACTYTLQMLDEPNITKTVTVALPGQNLPMDKLKGHTDGSGTHTLTVNGNSMDGPTQERAADAPKTCTHCICFYELVNEQKKMFELILNFQQKVVNDIQEVKQTVVQKLKDLEVVVKKQ